MVQEEMLRDWTIIEHMILNTNANVTITTHTKNDNMYFNPSLSCLVKIATSSNEAGAAGSYKTAD